LIDDLQRYSDNNMHCIYQLASLYKWLRHTGCHADVLRVVMDGYDWHVHVMYQATQHQRADALLKSLVMAADTFAASTAKNPDEHAIMQPTLPYDKDSAMMHTQPMQLLAALVTQRLSPTLLPRWRCTSLPSDATLLQAFAYIVKMAAWEDGWYHWRVGEACLYMEMARLLPDSARDVDCFLATVS
jgi:hypothetical protein